MKEKGSGITDVLALAAFAIFAVCILLVLLTGANVYQNLTERSQQQFVNRTAVNYLTTRVRQAQSVTVEEFYGCSTLALREEIDSEVYVTRVYAYNGTIRELYGLESAQLTLDDGEVILPMEAMSFTVEGDFLTAVLEDGQKIILCISAGRELWP
ncbi:MAG: DUF4860 domain-containing protein [Oscillospiraceae bacterium]|nr:DUF4860 domain-containing protein [Oscillospiraceae bacterium]